MAVHLDRYPQVQMWGAGDFGRNWYYLLVVQEVLDSDLQDLGGNGAFVLVVGGWVGTSARDSLLPRRD